MTKETKAIHELTKSILKLSQANLLTQEQFNTLYEIRKQIMQR